MIAKAHYALSFLGIPWNDRTRGRHAGFGGGMGWDGVEGYRQIYMFNKRVGLFSLAELRSTRFRQTWLPCGVFWGGGNEYYLYCLMKHTFNHITFA